MTRTTSPARRLPVVLAAHHEAPVQLVPPSAVTATAASTENGARTISGLLVPYGQVGHTSVGALTITAGAVQLPADLSRIKLFSGHDRERPIGYLTATDDRADGMYGTFRLGDTDAAAAALAEASQGLRDSLSVELVDVDADQAGTVTAASLAGVALVTVPAFDAARVDHVAASRPVTGAPPAGRPAARPLTAPSGLPSGATRRGLLTIRDVAAANAAFLAGERSAEVTAALADITVSANPYVEPVQYVGELWAGRRYQRRIVPLVSPGTLTSRKVTGWRWVVPPEVDDYAGDKADVPSNEPTTEPAEVTAQRLAGAHDFDRAFVDFGDTEFIASYYAHMTEDYARKSDARAAAALVAGAPAAGTAATPAAAIKAAVLAVAAFADVSWVLLNPAEWSTLSDTPNSDAPAWLSASLSLNPNAAQDFAGIRLVPSTAVPAGTVVAGAREAFTFYELPRSPIRVETINLVQGGVDGGVFGYYGTLVNDTRGLAKVTVGAGGAAARASK